MPYQSNVSLRHAWVAHRHRSERPIQRTPPPSRSLAGPRPRPRHDHLYSSSSSPHTVRLTVAASKGGEATTPSHTPPRRVRHPAPRFDLISAIGSSRSLALPPVVPRLHHASSCRPPPSFVPAPPPPFISHQERYLMAHEPLSRRSARWRRPTGRPWCRRASSAPLPPHSCSSAPTSPTPWRPP